MNASHSTLPPRLVAVHRWAHRQGWLRRFTLANRLLLAMAFLPTGLVKATGQRFTILSVDTPVGFFFESMYQTGPYWVFIGLVQVLAAIFLLIPRTATLGAVLFLPVALSVFLITWGVGFGNTVYVTGAMLLAATYLVCWDGDRVWEMVGPLLRPEQGGAGLLEGAERVEMIGWFLAAACGMGLFLITRNFLPASLTVPLFLGGLGAVLLVGLGWVVGWRRRRRA